MKYYIEIRKAGTLNTLFKAVIESDCEMEAGAKLHETAVKLGYWDQSLYSRNVMRASFSRRKVDQRLWFYDDLSNRLDEDKVKREQIETFYIFVQRYKYVDEYKYTKIKWSYDNEDLIDYQYTKKLIHEDDLSPVGGPEPENISHEEYNDMKSRHLIIENLKYWEISDTLEIIKYHPKKDQCNLFYEIFVMLAKESFINSISFMKSDIVTLKTTDINHFLEFVFEEMVKDTTILEKVEEKVSWSR